MNTDIKGDSTPPRKDQEKPPKKKSGGGWIFRTVLLTFAISVCFSLISEGLSESINLIAAAVLLLFFIFLGVFFDIIGVAVTTADPKNFNSMASRRVKGAKTALWCISKAPAVSNFCNDMIGDISGIISGSMGVVIADAIAGIFLFPKLLTMIVVTGLISALTVGGKAVGKNVSIKNANSIVFFVSKALSFLIPERFFSKK